LKNSEAKNYVFSPVKQRNFNHYDSSQGQPQDTLEFTR